ncbi:DUF2252 domain-containing protein [Oerskovia flava]|uniref:DUF2252 domain-containing protein n=1 Tax=Oerskovia flava TaxID=2986422 RepID=UPI00223FDEF7|nr:DUF2252 domain-containing protein [Oerskovia sp. JB1-3-2]
MDSPLSARSAVGKAARRRAPRSALGAWRPAADRPDPVGVLQAQATTRVPELVPIRYGRMLANPFAFFRGAAAIMAADLATLPTSGLLVQACGDAHLANFGLFGSPERTLVFDINDFDETLPGPWEWDVARLAASLAVAGRHNRFSPAERRVVVTAAAAEYRHAMAEFAAQRNLDVWYANARVEEGLPRVAALHDDAALKKARKLVAKARTKDSAQAASRLSHVVDGKVRLLADPPLLVPIEDLLTPELAASFTDWIREVLAAYRSTLPPDRRLLLDQFRLVHVARKVVGVGSVGTRVWVLLMEGRDTDDPLVLQAKEAEASVLEPHLAPSRFGQHGRRVVEGQRLMQATSDIFLGWTRTDGLDGRTHDYYIRQLRDWKGSWDPEEMGPTTMAAFGTSCAWTLARAHARSGDRVAIASYLGRSDTFDRAVADFAELYADQNEHDHTALTRAVDDGRCTAQTGL